MKAFNDGSFIENGAVLESQLKLAAGGSFRETQFRLSETESPSLGH